MAVLKWLGAGALALAAGLLGLVVLAGVALGIALTVLDGNDAKPYLTGGLGAALGREVQIEGDLQIDAGLQPRIVAHGVKVADAPWAQRPYMVEIARVVLRFDVPSLLRGEIMVLELALDEPAVTLATAADGRRNWAFLTDEQATEDDAPLPVVESLRIRDAVLTYVDGARGTRTQALLDSADGSLTGRQRRLAFQAAGTVEGAPLRMSASAEALAPTAEAGKPLPLHAEVDLAGTRAVVDGSVSATPDGSARFTLDLLTEAPEIANLRAVLPWELPPDWPGFRVQARAVGSGERLALEDIRASLGESDVGGRIGVELGGERPQITAVLQSRTIDVVQLVGRPSEQPGPIIPETPIDFDALHAFDAELRFDGRTMYIPQLSFEHVAVGAAVRDGILRVDPLRFQIGDGRVRTNMIQVDARQEPAEVQVDVDIEDLGLNAMLQEFGVNARAFGRLNGGVQLTGGGRSAAAILGSADGSVELIMQGGQLDALLSSLAGQDITEVLDALALDEDQATVELRCFIADFDARDGVFESSTFVLDSANAMIVGGGDIDLDEQSVNLAFLPQHKEATPLAAQAPVHVAGDLNDINVAVNTGAAIASLITPVELPDADDVNCDALARSVREG